MHGSKNRDGLILKSSELISWLELTNRFREINLLTGNNLLISLATCFGAYIYREIKCTDATPVWGFIGAWEEVSSGDIEISYQSFFESLLTDLSMNNAVKKLNETNQLPTRYHFFDTEAIFDRVFQVYESEYYLPEVHEKRITDLIAEALSKDEIRRSMSIPQIRGVIKNMLEPKEKVREYFRKRFLMLT
ncbi:MAG TPA: hypothetical protein VE978_22970 [Chitinophagales bacterium]|nr:hypothetical protein [Chitinophagales bacterium]